MIKKTGLADKIPLENKMSVREKQKARREAARREREEFERKTGLVNKWEGMNFEQAIE